MVWDELIGELVDLNTHGSYVDIIVDIGRLVELPMPLGSITYIRESHERDERRVSILKTDHSYIIRLDREPYNYLRKKLNIEVSENACVRTS